MATGTVLNVVVCVARAPSATASVAPCTTVAGVRYQPSVVSAYLVDPANASLFDLATEPLDVASVGAVWSVGFSFVVLCFLVGRGLGSVLTLIRNG